MTSLSTIQSVCLVLLAMLALYTVMRPVARFLLKYPKLLAFVIVVSLLLGALGVFG